MTLKQIEEKMEALKLAKKEALKQEKRKKLKALNANKSKIRKIDTRRKIILGGILLKADNKELFDKIFEQVTERDMKVFDEYNSYFE